MYNDEIFNSIEDLSIYLNMNKLKLYNMLIGRTKNKLNIKYYE